MLDRASDDVVLMLKGPLPPTEAEELWEGAANTAMAVAWTGKGLIVSYEGGVARWACGDEVMVESGAIEVAVDGNATVSMGERATFNINADTTQGPAVRYILVDGEPAGGGASLGNEVAWWTYTTGTFVITAVVDDGVRRGSAEFTVTVE